MENLVKRTSLIILGLAFFSSIQSAVAIDSTSSFSDVPSTQQNYDAINYVYDQNIVEGYKDGTFHPDSLINRAEFTKIITEAYHQGQAEGSDCFPDVKKEWFAKYICFGKINNFVAGYPDGNFKPGNNINLVEVAKILVNSKGFKVTPDSNVWYKPYVQKLSELNVIPASIKSFDQKVTRGEMAEMVYRLNVNIINKPAATYKKLVAEQESPGLPVRIKISEINVDAAIESIGLTSGGAVDIPKDPANAAWYNLGPRPGDKGNAIITGHLNWYDGAVGVFADLNKMKIGDKIEVQDDKGAVRSFEVSEIKHYDYTANAVDVFNSTDGKSHLNLITCEGAWNEDTQSYAQRLVIFADEE